MERGRLARLAPDILLAGEPPALRNISLLDFPLFCLIMRHFAAQKLATGFTGAESNQASSIQYSSEQLYR
jgi:hypothetical protein